MLANLFGAPKKDASPAKEKKTHQPHTTNTTQLPHADAKSVAYNAANELSQIRDDDDNLMKVTTDLAANADDLNTPEGTLQPERASALHDALTLSRRILTRHAHRTAALAFARSLAATTQHAASAAAAAAVTNAWPAYVRAPSSADADADAWGSKVFIEAENGLVLCVRYSLAYDDDVETHDLKMLVQQVTHHLKQTFHQKLLQETQRLLHLRQTTQHLSQQKIHKSLHLRQERITDTTKLCLLLLT